MGKGRARLLEFIDEKGSINSAASELKMSYRHAWAILKKISEALGEDVVRSERGGSGGGGVTKLTDAGKGLLDEYRDRKKGLDRYLRYGRRPALTVDGVVVRKGEVGERKGKDGSEVGDGEGGDSEGGDGEGREGERGEQKEILLIRRKNPPFEGMYALPGGFVDYGERMEEAVVRELEEETGLRTRVTGLVGVYSDPDRDPRGHTVSPAYLLETVGGELRAGDDAAEAVFFPADDLPELAFDHSLIVKDALAPVRYL